MKHKDLMGKFGMAEMESAASRILTILEEENRTSGINDMKDDMERIGYIELLHCGWLETSPVHHHYNGSFQPTLGFFQRCKVARPEWLKCRSELENRDARTQ